MLRNAGITDTKQQQKRYRLKKYITTIRQDKKCVNERRFRDKAK